MSIALAFDTHEFITTLESSGIPKSQAEAQAHALRRALETALPEQTKAQQDIVARAVDELDTKTETAIALLRKDMQNGFALIETRFNNAMETRFVAIDARFDAMEARFDARFVAMETRFDAIETRFDARFGAMETRFDAIDARFGAMDTKFALQMDALQNKLLIKLSLVMVLVGLLVTAQRFFL